MLPTAADDDDDGVVQIITGDNFFELVVALVLPKVRDSIDCFIDPKDLSSFARSIAALGENRSPGYVEGMKLKCVTEVTKENLQHCKGIMKRQFDIYHTSLLRGNYIIADKTVYLGQVSNESEGEEKKSLYVCNSPFVTSQQFLFDNLIEKAVPARQRMQEIGRGIETEFMETIRDPLRVKALVFELVKSALLEICMLFPTKNSFLIAEREGILNALGAASERGINIKLLVMHDEVVKEVSNAKLKGAHQNIQVNYLKQFLPTKITTLIVDQTKSLSVEVNDDTKETLEEAIGLAAFSNSESTVFSNSSIFESFWIQSLLDKQHKARQAYFQMFKGLKIKDEVYNRRWTFGLDKKETQEG